LAAPVWLRLPVPLSAALRLAGPPQRVLLRQAVALQQELVLRQAVA
jgi:hypothetical protein